MEALSVPDTPVRRCALGCEFRAKRIFIEMKTTYMFTPSSDGEKRFVEGEKHTGPPGVDRYGNRTFRRDGQMVPKRLFPELRRSLHATETRAAMLSSAFFK